MAKKKGVKRTYAQRQAAVGKDRGRARVPVPVAVAPEASVVGDENFFTGVQIARMAGVPPTRFHNIVKRLQKEPNRYTNKLTSHNSASGRSRLYSRRAIGELQRLVAEIEATPAGRGAAVRYGHAERSAGNGQSHVAGAAIEKALAAQSKTLARIAAGQLSLARQIRDLQKTLVKVLERPVRVRLQR